MFTLRFNFSSLMVLYKGSEASLKEDLIVVLADALLHHILFSLLV